MEPITLCGLVIVVFGLWIEFESILKMLVNIIGNSKIPAGIKSLFLDQMTDATNRYIQYTR